MPEINSPTRWWTAKELATHYGISVRTIYDAIAARRLVVHRFGVGRGGIRIADEDRLAWEQNSKQADHVPKSPSTNWNERLAMSELVQKHFGT